MSSGNEQPGLLDGIRVLDATQVVAGSFASMMLADMGADVLKIERPERGDIGRTNPPFVDGHSAYFSAVNRNKRSAALDLRSEEGREAFLDLAEVADVVVENFRPGAMDRLGVGYEAVRERNDSVIYCSVSGFGQTGPYAEYPALDIVAQAMSGNMSITGPPDGIPHRAGIPIADISGSMHAAQSVLAALFYRERTETGQHIDVSMLDGMISWLTVRAGYTFASGERYPRTGNKLEEFVPYGVFETDDSYIVVVAVQNRHWQRLSEAIGRPELGTDDRFATPESRRENREVLEGLLEDVLLDRTTEEWFDIFAEHGVPAGPVYDTLELWEDEHVQARDLRQQVEVDGTTFDVIDYPVKFSETRAGITGGVARLGEHTREALETVGYTEAELDQFAEAGIIDEPRESHR